MIDYSDQPDFNIFFCFLDLKFIYFLSILVFLFSLTKKKVICFLSTQKIISLPKSPHIYGSKLATIYLSSTLLHHKIS